MKTGSESTRVGAAPPWHVRLSLYAVVASALVFSLISPITGGDNDLWTHLNLGRYIIEHRALPQDAFYSFIEPQRPMILFYWLYEALLYPYFTLTGYVGLIALRTALLAGFALMAYLLMRRMGRARQGMSHSYAAVAFILLLAVELQRYQLVRPHSISYLLAMGFICLLEYRPRGYLMALPMLSLLWVNLHGILYPLMLIVLGAYGMEAYYVRIRERRAFEKEELALVASLTLSALAIFMTPMGTALLSQPFVESWFAREYIPELGRIEFPAWFAFYISLEKGVPSYIAFFNALLVLAAYSVYRAVRGADMRIAHLVMFVAGAILVSRHVRLISEFAILAYPFILYNTPLRTDRGPSIPSRLVYAGLAIAIPISFMMNVYPYDERYPLSPGRLPLGVAAFIRHVGADSPGRVNVLNEAYNGGSLEWALGGPGSGENEYRIHMDMITPHVFGELEMFENLGAFRDPTVLGNLLERYDIHYISAPIDEPGFGQIIARHPEFMPVFFDGEDHLYANSLLLSDVAGKYALTIASPYSLNQPSIMALDSPGRERLGNELRRMDDIHPGIESVSLGLGLLALADERTDLALEYARALMEAHPEGASGTYLTAMALARAGDHAGAIRMYEEALGRLPAELSHTARRGLSASYHALGRFEDAYEAFRASIAGGIYLGRATDRELYVLGSLAAEAGHGAEARELMRMALLKSQAGGEIHEAILGRVR